jgi:hypothetical protein
MRIHIEGVRTPVPSMLLGWIAERLEALNTLSADISHAYVALVQHTAPLELAMKPACGSSWRGASCRRAFGPRRRMKRPLPLSCASNRRFAEAALNP